MALGAGRWSVIRESLWETMIVFSAGLAAGIVAAIAAVRLTASLLAGSLFRLTTTDAANIAGALLLMVAVALGASILPGASRQQNRPSPPFATNDTERAGAESVN